MADKQVTVKTRKFLRNPLLQRRQMVVDVIHPDLPPVKKEIIAAELAKLYKTDVKNVFVFGFKTPFGGGKSSGFGLIYDNQGAAEKFEPRYRLVRAGLKDAKKRTRKQWKDLKKKRRTTWGTGKRAEARKARKAAAA